MRRFTLLLSVLLLSALLAACGQAAAPAPAAGGDDAGSTDDAATESSSDEAAPAADGDRVQIRWYVGLGTGTNPEQIPVEEAVVEEFNNSQDEIELILEIVPFEAAKDTLATQIASGAGPDIIGPVGVGGSNAFVGQYLDLSPLIEASGYDLSQFNEELIKFYQTEEGQVGIPFAVFPAAIWYQKAMFDEAGLNYPPATYGEPYVMADGSEVEWNFDTLTEIARILTVDANGNDATMEEFDATQIVQYGYVPQNQVEPAYVGTYWGAGSVIGEDGTAQVPEQWKEAWDWWYDGMWGEQPFIPTEAVYQSPDFGAGNLYNAGKAAMSITPAWYTCCVGDAGDSWDLAALPAGPDGEIHGRTDADTFRIWKGTENPEAAFEVLQYLTGDASLALLDTYGGMPSRAEDVQQWFDSKAEQYPFVENWDIFTAGLAYPDVPSAEAFVPSWLQVWDRLSQFGSLLRSTEGVDVSAEIETLEADLSDIFAAAGE